MVIRRNHRLHIPSSELPGEQEIMDADDDLDGVVTQAEFILFKVEKVC